MNIVRALDVALPELPERLIQKNPPKLDPTVISKQHIENGDPVILAKKPGTDLVFRFKPVQWQLIELFDGKRTPKEVSAAFEQQTGMAVAPEDVRELASYLQSNSQLLYKRPFEQNILLQQELRSSRKKRSRFHVADMSDITLKVWPNADGYITRLYPKLKFMFTPWFVGATLLSFVLMIWMWADRFGEIWADSFAFYNFTAKSGVDLLEFWFLFGAMAASHETAHGLVGKHFGAKIERMGFNLLYFAPSFFCDATQVWVLGGRWARIATAIAGIWLDLVICFLATVVWWATPTGMGIHDWSYKIMMVTGIGVSLLNLNPLIKLDGYLIFSELVSEPALKENSTEFLSGWIRKHVFGLPVDLLYVPRRKRAFYVVYAILSGLYSYTLLSFLMVITYHILLSYTPEWAFLPAAVIGYWVFRSRIKLLGKFMRILYLDKKERVRSWLTPSRSVATAAAVVVALFLPVWPEFVHAPFTLEAAQRVVVRATTPATVLRVDAGEGQRVGVGAPLIRLQNLELESQAAQAKADLAVAERRATQASIAYAGFAAADEDRRQLAEKERLLRDKLAQLEIVSPIAGLVTTAHPGNLVGASVDEGDVLLELANTQQMRARVYVPEFAMHDLKAGARVRLHVDGQFRTVSGAVSSVSAATTSIAAGLVPKAQLQGINPPRYYTANVFLDNDGSLQDGATGSAKVFVRRGSLAGRSWRFLAELLGRKVW
ncbi:MAG TPA: HlyD family efflux transporter periplasmic adaptor subunit [Terriglobales bacterium]|nr:HlyD family efflux transporter periplasmic adaptor subunit [Terriglobales bacterium]